MQKHHYTPILRVLTTSPLPVEELLSKLTELQSAVNTGKDSL